MQKNELIKLGNNILRIVEIKETSALVIDCQKRFMPCWVDCVTIADCELCTEEEMQEKTGILIFDIAEVDGETRKIIHERFTLIAGIIPFVADEKVRTDLINRIASTKKISKQTIRHYLCLYLVFQDISVLAPKQIIW